MMPPGSDDVLGDSAYRGVENCDTIRDSRRRPIIDHKSDAAPHGFNAKAEMLRFRDEHPGTFYGILHIKNNVESVFSSMKERFGGVVRAFKTRTQAVELLSMCICYHMSI